MVTDRQLTKSRIEFNEIVKIYPLFIIEECSIHFIRKDITEHEISFTRAASGGFVITDNKWFNLILKKDWGSLLINPHVQLSDEFCVELYNLNIAVLDVNDRYDLGEINRRYVINNILE